VENATLRGQNPQTSEEIDIQREKLTGLKQEVDKLPEFILEQGDRTSTYPRERSS